MSAADTVPEIVAGAPSILVVVGPTASGKSRLAAELGARLGGEVLSADSVQVYRGFDIGSGKADQTERALCPHHLLDIRDPTQTLEAMQWAELARPLIEEIDARGKVPIVCGGTFLWVRALLYGLAEAPPGDETLRAEHQRFAEEHSRAALHERLAVVDPESAQRLHENDLVRVSRALEVHQLTGEKLSDIQARHGFRTQHYPAQLLGIDWPRDEYDARVTTRVSGMLSAGFEQEVAELSAAGFGGSRAMDAVGYRQVYAAAQATEAERPSHEQLLAEIVRVTRIFARRQRTWLKNESIRWLPPDVLNDASALEQLASELKIQLTNSAT